MSSDEVQECSSDWKAFSSFHINQLVAIVRDLFLAGSETTATSLSWIVLYLCKYQGVQKKMQDEIDDVIGQSGIPKMGLMDKMPYVRSVIQVPVGFVFVIMFQYCVIVVCSYHTLMQCYECIKIIYI